MGLATLRINSKRPVGRLSRCFRLNFAGLAILAFLLERRNPDASRFLLKRPYFIPFDVKREKRFRLPPHKSAAEVWKVEIGGLGKNGSLLKIIGRERSKLRRNATFLRKLLKKNAFWDKIGVRRPRTFVELGTRSASRNASPLALKSGDLTKKTNEDAGIKEFKEIV